LKPVYISSAIMVPPLRPWSQSPENRCIPDEIPSYWKTHEVITFLAQTGIYDRSLYRNLDRAEKERVLQLKSDYFKQRFVVSRCLLKTIIAHLDGTENREGVVLSLENRGIRVQGRPDLSVSLSYSGRFIALSLGKRKIGSDIEIVSSVEIPKMRSSPLFGNMVFTNKNETSPSALHAWTLVEAFAKLRDVNPFPLLSSDTLFPGAGFISYCIDHTAVFSLAYEGDTLNDTLLQVDPASRDSWFSQKKNTVCSPDLRKGDTYVRA